MRILLHCIQLQRPAVSPAGPSHMHRRPRDCHDTKRSSRTNSGGKVSSPQPRQGGKREGHTGDPILAIDRRSQHQLRHCVMARDAHPTVRDRSRGRGYGSRAPPAPTYFRWWTSPGTLTTSSQVLGAVSTSWDSAMVSAAESRAPRSSSIRGEVGGVVAAAVDHPVGAGVGAEDLMAGGAGPGVGAAVTADQGPGQVQ